MQDIREGMQQVRDDAVGIKSVLERMERERGNRNMTTVRIEGAGSAWAALAAGLAIGVSLGASIACAAWVAATLGDLTDDQRNDDAFIQATYQAVPGLREQFDKIKAEQDEPQE